MKFFVQCFVLAVLLLAAGPSGAPAAVTVDKWTDQPDEWFNSEEGRRIVDNVLSWQNANGGWWKSYDTTVPRSEEGRGKPNPAAPKSDSPDAWSATSTIDNHATYSELRLLARAARVTGRDDTRQAFARGLKFLFDSQYPNGGWPQRFPLEKNYGRHITYNDNAMVNVLRLLRDTAKGEGDFAWVDEPTRTAAAAAFDRGIDCVLKTQIRHEGRLAVWCQQHDAQTLQPTSARAYELPSYCSTESAELTLLLMDLPNPDARVRDAVEASVAWFDAHKILGKRYDRITKEDGVYRILSDDPDAPPIWARFYEIETGRPFFCDRDGIKKYSLSEIGQERQRGYAWYNASGNRVLDRHPKWKAKLAAGQ